ncbi:hypothetical protein DYB37_006618 [Aphanomyces astaci]|uniref:Uncharacterized protein n=1 Tax=Aphanomyces astaci TaxID=112090 RepID=A0A3R6XTG4_APHAT|nr:hypothetical protein DYB35_006094 [Aphanomyces astaci]RHZ26802.1 hypothetical protein DYB37_006618 [Aphanomyces astaci]
MAKSCVLLQDAEVISLPCDPSSASLSPDGMVVTGWTSGNTLHAYYGGEAILSRAVDLPSSAWKSFLVKSRVASASLFEFVLLVVCIDGSVCRIRVQSAHDTIQLLAQVSQSHPTLTACDVCDNGRLLVLAGGIRSNAKDMEHGSTLSIWNVLDESAELLHYSTVLAHDKLVMDAVPAAAAPSSWWSLLSGAEQLYPGYIQDIAISPDNTLVALRDSSGHVVFASRVSQGRWDDALEVARVHPAAALDADVVHKAAWVAFVQSAATSTSAQLDQVLRTHVTNILDKRWSLDSIRHCVLDTPAACHRVWSFGLSTVVDDGHDVALLQLLDRLDTFLRLLWADECSIPATSSFELLVAMDTLAECFDVASFRQFLDRSWVDIAMALATAGRVSALTVRHLSSPM